MVHFLAGNRKIMYAVHNRGAAAHINNRRNIIMILADKIMTLRKKAGWS